MTRWSYLESLGWICLLRLSLDTEWISRIFCQLSPEDTERTDRLRTCGQTDRLRTDRQRT